MPDETPETEAADAELSDLLDTPATEDAEAAGAQTDEATHEGAVTPVSPEPVLDKSDAGSGGVGSGGATPVAPAEKPGEAAAAPEHQPTKSEARLAELDTLIDADDFDAYSREGKRILKERGDVAAEVRVEPLRQQIHNATIWTNLSETHELPVKELRAAWDDVKKKYPGKSQEVLDFAFEQRIETMKSEKTEKPKPVPTAAAAPAPTPQPKPRATIAPKPGAVAPNQPSAHRPPVPAADAGAGFDRTVSREELASFPN
jgi:hypothetical protein